MLSLTPPSIVDNSSSSLKRPSSPSSANNNNTNNNNNNLGHTQLSQNNSPSKVFTNSNILLTSSTPSPSTNLSVEDFSTQSISTHQSCQATPGSGAVPMYNNSSKYPIAMPSGMAICAKNSPDSCLASSYFSGFRRHSTIESTVMPSSQSAPFGTYSTDYYHNNYGDTQPSSQLASSSLLQQNHVNSSSSSLLSEGLLSSMSSSSDLISSSDLKSSYYGDSTSLLTLPKKISLYKTELCRTFEETGYCRYGVKCQFAHDKAELRVIPRHPRYKTEICRTFWELGNCPYGKRCCFIHLEAGTLMNGKPPGQAKIGLENQFNGPVAQGFQRDQSFKSADSDLSSFKNSGPSQYPSYHTSCLAVSKELSNDSSLSLSSDFGSIAFDRSNASGLETFPCSSDWMRSRRSQSFSHPNSSSWPYGGKPLDLSSSSTSGSYSGLLEDSNNHVYALKESSNDDMSSHWKASLPAAATRSMNNMMMKPTGSSISPSVKDSVDTFSADSLLSHLQPF